MLKALLVIILLVFSFSNLNAHAASPHEYCTEHTAAMAGGTCIECTEDNCLVIIGNLGDRICKQCNEVQCTLVHCKRDCPSCPVEQI